MAKKSALIEAVKSIRYARQLTNWYEVGAAAWQGDEPAHLRLRAGPVLEGAPGTQLVYLFKEIFYRDAYGLRRQPLDPGGTVIDIGANIGVFALYAMLYGQAARVIAFEPSPQTFDLLCRNVERNGMSAIKPVCQGVAGTRGGRRLHVHGPAAGHSLFGTGDATVSIECVSLADMFRDQCVDRCDFLRLDCEGAEYEILLQTPAAILERIDRVALEYHDSPTPHTHHELTRSFERGGFHVQWRDHPRSRTGFLFARRLAGD